MNTTQQNHFFNTITNIYFLYYEHRLKVNSATKRWLLKICHLRHKLTIFLFRRKVMFRSQDILVFVFLTSFCILTIPWFTKSVTSWWALVHEERCIFEYNFWTTTWTVDIHGHVQNSVYSFWPFADIDTPTHFVVSSLSMLFLPKYILLF